MGKQGSKNKGCSLSCVWGRLCSSLPGHLCRWNEDMEGIWAGEEDRRGWVPAGKRQRLRVVLASRWSRAGTGRASHRSGRPSCLHPRLQWCLQRAGYSSEGWWVWKHLSLLLHWVCVSMLTCPQTSTLLLLNCGLPRVDRDLLHTCDYLPFLQNWFSVTVSSCQKGYFPVLCFCWV